MNILPNASAYVVTTETLPRAKEYAWDMEKLDFKTEGGRIQTVYDNEAIALWIWKAFSTRIERWVVYPADYGSDVWELIGYGYSRGFMESEAKRIFEETVEESVGDYIESIDKVDVSFSDHRLIIDAEITTVYGKGGVSFEL